jgi:predicted MPP superfamily phosphohydrolase
MPDPAPPTTLVEPHVLWFEDLPDALDGLTILQLTDLHVRESRPRHDQIIAALREQAYDLLLITGDIMNEPGDEPASHELVLRICRAAQPRIGTFASPGNHDSAHLKAMLADLPLTWLHDEAWCSSDLPLTIMGLEYDRVRRKGDLVRTIRTEPAHDEPRFRILLAHAPNWLPGAADVGVNLMLSGHTHGGQIRLPGRRMLINKCDWPLHLSTGVLRLKQTRAVISRGLGESGPIEGLRLLCHPHMPLITLGKGPCEIGDTKQITIMQEW